jgi:hypothetical protein
MKNKRSYRQCVIDTDTHPILQKGQIVDIIFEGYDFYTVQSFTTGTQENIKKEFVITH